MRRDIKQYQHLEFVRLYVQDFWQMKALCAQVLLDLVLKRSRLHTFHSHASELWGVL